MSRISLPTEKGRLRTYILKFIYNELKKNNFKRGKTAEKLGISARTLRNYVPMLEEEGYEVPKDPRQHGRGGGDPLYYPFPTNEERINHMENPHNQWRK